MAERVIVQLQHANSAVVLTAIKALLYLMNYMDDRRLMEYICKKMGPPLGMYFYLVFRIVTQSTNTSHITFIWSGSAICRTPKYSPHHSKTAICTQERCQSLLLQIQWSYLCQACEIGDHVSSCERRERERSHSWTARVGTGSLELNLRDWPHFCVDTPQRSTLISLGKPCALLDDSQSKFSPLQIIVFRCSLVSSRTRCPTLCRKRSL